MVSWAQWGRMGVAVAALGLTLTPLGGCKDFFIDPALTAVSVSPATPSVVVGKTQQMTALGTYDNGVKSSVTEGSSWSSSDVSIATVSSSGLVTGVSAGSATIAATNQGVSGSTTVSIVTSALESISITPASASLSPGQSQQFTAVGLLADGSNSTITTSVTWSSSDTSIATIDSGGYCVAKSGSTSGSTKVTATSGSVTSNSATVTVK
jgi:uncharacterized protein YjdB